MTQTLQPVKERGINHEQKCLKNEEPQIMGFLALKQLMWTCVTCGKIATVNPMDEDNPWGRG